VKAYLAGIPEVNHKYHSVIETNPDALIVAEVPNFSLHRGLHHGISILLKDNIPTLDATETTYRI
jgi:amidase